MKIIAHFRWKVRGTPDYSANREAIEVTSVQTAARETREWVEKANQERAEGQRDFEYVNFLTCEHKEDEAQKVDTVS